MGPIQKLDHFNLRTNRPQETIDFYVGVLGLENRPEDRPDFNFPGAWLWAGDTALVHLVFSADDPGPAAGSLDHVAFAIDDFDAIAARLDEAEVEYRSSVRPEMGLSQIFVRDPNGVLVELNQRAE